VALPRLGGPSKIDGVGPGALRGHRPVTPAGNEEGRR
jgi:hypothetical protein